MHTRFEHSLGVCYQIKRLLSHPDFFPAKYKPDADKRRLIELAGLLHDIIHTPFKHTLDRDAAVLPQPDLAEEYNFRFEQIKLNNKLGASDIQFLCAILSTVNPFNLDEPYLRQIIEDTISADLLDYSRRDTYFTTGWGRQWDERLYDHIAVALYSSKPCLVARIAYENGKVTPSAITELISLLQIRYMLNERVYFYPTKIAADSLLVKSVRYLIQTQMDPQKFQGIIKDMSDEELVNYLALSATPESSYYAKLLKDRHLPAMAHVFHSRDISFFQRENIHSCCRGYHRLEEWKKCEEKIGDDAGVDPKNIIVYCHDIEMQKKKPDFLVQADFNSEPEPVDRYEGMKEEIEAIGRKHENLWRCYVFSIDRSPEVLNKIDSSAGKILMNIKSV